MITLEQVPFFPFHAYFPPIYLAISWNVLFALYHFKFKSKARALTSKLDDANNFTGLLKMSTRYDQLHEPLNIT